MPTHGFPSWSCHLRPSHASLPTFPRASPPPLVASPCPCLLVPAGVAVHSTSLATTAQRARGQCTGQSRLLCRKRCCKGCAGRQVPASPPTCSFGTWTCQSHVTMVDDWKSWLTGFHCAMVLSSPLTPHWSLQFVQTVSPRRQCAHVDGAALAQARRVKQRAYPELSGNRGRARLGCSRS